MSLNLSIDEVLTTTRSVRKRLDLDRPVPREVLTECLELAIQAPTGSNAQGWQWVFVEDADKKKAIADIYRAGADWYRQMPRAEYPEGDIRGERMDLVTESALYLADHLHEVPVLLIPCLEGRVEKMPQLSSAFWASLFPAAWSFCLALRSRGLGSCWTTFHLLSDGEKQAAEILGIHYEKYSQGGLFPIAYTNGTDFRPAKRLPVDQIVHWDSW
jgi:nitroreductase